MNSHSEQSASFSEAQTRLHLSKHQHSQASALHLESAGLEQSDTCFLVLCAHPAAVQQISDAASTALIGAALPGDAAALTQLHNTSHQPSRPCSPSKKLPVPLASLDMMAATRRVLRGVAFDMVRRSHNLYGICPHHAG